MIKEIIADVWVKCEYDSTVLHKLHKGMSCPEYICRCIGIDLLGKLKEGDEIIYEEVNNGTLLV